MSALLQSTPTEVNSSLTGTHDNSAGGVDKPLLTNLKSPVLLSIYLTLREVFKGKRNTKVEVDKDANLIVYLHNNPIFTLTGDKQLILSNCGWPALVTTRRLNQCLKELWICYLSRSKGEYKLIVLEDEENYREKYIYTFTDKLTLQLQ